jgi:hypothetical protein
MLNQQINKKQDAKEESVRQSKQSIGNRPDNSGRVDPKKRKTQEETKKNKKYTR